MSYSTVHVARPFVPPGRRRQPVLPVRNRFVPAVTRSRVVRFRGRTINLQTPAQVDGLGFSLRPPRWARKTLRSVTRAVRSGVAIAASAAIPGGGLIFGSRRAPRWLRAPKGVRPFVRTAAKVQLAAGAVIAAGMLAPAILPGLTKLAPLVTQLLPKSGGSSSSGETVYPAAGSSGGGEGYSYGGGGEGGGGGGGAADPVMDQQSEEAGPAVTPTQAGGGALVIGGLALLAVMASRRRRRG